MIDTLKGKTKSYSKTFGRGNSASEIDQWIDEKVETEIIGDESVITSLDVITKHKYVIIITKIIQDDQKKY